MFRVLNFIALLFICCCANAFAGAGYINVLDYGAVCDQTTDDTTAIRNAITAANGVQTSPLKTHALGVIIPGQCLITGPITVRNAQLFAGSIVGAPFIIQCGGGASGLLWGGADNTGPMLILGDSTNSQEDTGVEIRNCTIGGTFTKKPSVILQIYDNFDVHIHDNWFHIAHNAISCTGSCLLMTIDRNYFASCFTDCIYMNGGHAVHIRDNTFNSCGQYCIDGASLDNSEIAANYFQGNIGPASSDVGGSKGSVYLSGSNVLRDNTYEDANGAAGTGFRSVTIAAGQNVFSGNYYGANATYPGGPSYYIVLLGSSSGEFHGEQNFSSMGAGSSGFGIDVQTSVTGGAVWFGGQSCDASKIFGGSNGPRGTLVNACGTTYSGTYGAFTISNAGIINSPQFVAGGYSPSITGTCAPSVGVQRGSTSGYFVASNVCSSGALIFTFSTVAPTGWACNATDQTTSADLVQQSGFTATTATFAATFSTNDHVSYQCSAF